MADKKVRVGVVGVGHFGRNHARIYAGMEGVELAVVADHDPERRGAMCEVYGCKGVVDHTEITDVDAVSIAVPTSNHADVACYFLERGIPVLVEKPLAKTVEEADAIIAAAERGGALLTVGHVERFQPGLKRVREMGMKPRFIECHRLAPVTFRSMDVGVVHDLMIHDLDLVLDLIDSEVVSVDAAGGAILTATEDVASVRLVFENGARANVTASRASMKPMRRFRLFSSEGYVSLDFTENYGLLVRKGAQWDERRGDLMRLDPAELAAKKDWMMDGMLDVTELELDSDERPLQAELAAFLDCVREGKQPEVSGHDGRRALELAERITAAIQAENW
jgi:predicted dehydrogenase